MSGPRKTAIVTGASQGIGAGIMQVLLELRAPFGSLRYLERLGSWFGCADARRVPITGQEAVLV
jgi:NAD(P)-dependent dehydrogenase (short-subunit alcohol dehydrogenase family)